jgi:hypothetical protein
LLIVGLVEMKNEVVKSAMGARKRVILQTQELIDASVI